MPTVAIHPPKTPVTKGSNTVAAATLPNVCKMPGPPAPFVPTPLPNIGRSALSPKDYSKKVKIEGNPVAIGSANFASQGDMASKGTGGGIVSANTHGITKFIMPGSFTVKIEGKGVHLLGEPMLNNCGPSGSPPNAATMQGATHAPAPVPSVDEIVDMLCQDLCDHENGVKEEKHRRSSNDLEKKCRDSEKYDPHVLFRQRIPTPKNDPPFSTKHTKPDAINADKSQCYDFKLCGDRSRGDQLERQAAISGGADPIIISCDECTTCDPTCEC